MSTLSPAPAAPTPAEAAPDRPISLMHRLGGWLLSTEGVADLVVLGSLMFAYWPTLIELVTTWRTQPDYSHGFLVVPIAAWILARLWPQTAEDAPRVFWPGLLVVILGLGLRTYFVARGSYWSANATLLIAVAGVALSRLGWRNLRSTWPAVAFLVFLLPLPGAINNTLSQPLRGLATFASSRVLRATGLWVMNEGNVIIVGGEPLEVAEACNGLSMLMSLAATVAAAAALISMAPLKRIVLLLSIVPIALLSNVLRITATAWAYYLFGAKVGSQYAHDAAGFLMMPLAMGLVGLEIWIMSLVVVETTVDAPTDLRFDPGFVGPNRPGLGGATR